MKNIYIGILFLFFIELVTAQEQFSVYFDTNKYELTKVETDRLDNWMKANATSKILAIKGYTDEDGATELNDTLAQRRVSHVFNIINGKVITDEDFKTRSFGELHKMSPVKAENRKVTLYYIQVEENSMEAEEPIIEKSSKEVAYKNLAGEIKTSGKGEKLRLKGLNFYGNSGKVLPASQPVLHELLKIMKENPKLKIDIQGHICCEFSDNGRISELRARAVYNFLTENGIDKNRLSYHSFGSNNPIYPLPEKSIEERVANRRVEIEIVDN